MRHRDIVVIGGSAGCMDALSVIAPGLPADLPAAIFLVVHTAPDSPGYLAEILTRMGPLRASYPKDGEEFSNGAIYLAPPDYHLLLEPPKTMRVIRGPRENRTRPAVDPLFRSAALAFGPRVIGIVLSGGLDDGTAGLRSIKMCGGTTVVQDPADALVSSMPHSAVLNVTIDHCTPARQLAALIAELVATPCRDRPQEDETMRKLLKVEVEMAKGRGGHPITELGEPSLYTCPECHGTLVKLRGENPMRFRCHTGHAFTADSLLAELSEVTEAAIWNTIRSLQESAILMRHLADHWRATDAAVADGFLRKARAAQARSDMVRHLASEHEALSEGSVEAESR